ncbi:hypothetical protein Tco_0662347, partial [Tanacetum coccineum]
ISGLEDKAQKVAKDFDEFLESVLEEHLDERRRMNGQSDEEKDLVDILLDLQRDDAIGFTLHRDIIKAIILMTTSSANNSVFRGFFEKQKLTGPNFIDWYRQLRIVLSIEDKLNYLEQPLPPAPVAPEGQQVAPEIIAAHTAWIKGSKEIVGLMLMTMEPEIQQNLENLHAYEMLQELKTMFAQQAEQELLQTTQDFHSCKQEEGAVC